MTRTVMLVDFFIGQRDGAHRTVRLLACLRGRTEPNVERVRREPIAGFTEGMKPVTGPTPILWRDSNTRAKRIQVDIAEAVVPIPLIVEQSRAVPAVPDGADSSIFSIEIASVTHPDRLHRPR